MVARVGLYLKQHVLPRHAPNCTQDGSKDLTSSIRFLVRFFTQLLMGVADVAFSTGALKLPNATDAYSEATGVLFVKMALLIIISVPSAAFASRIRVRISTLV
jgi:hypothetical protein